MDYEEKYNDLLLRIKRMADVQPDVTRVAIESLFPELKDSEDERIKKELIDKLNEELRDISFTINQTMPPECNDEEDIKKQKFLQRSIAWLEKQGEQNSKEYWLKELGFEQNGYDPVHVLKTIKGKWPMAWEKVLYQEKKPVEKGEPITEGLKTEFQKQVSYLIASVMNREHAYTQGYVEWVAQSLLGYAKNELEQKTAGKVEPKFKVKYANSEYNVLETKEIAGVTYYGIEDEPNHIDYVLPDNCKIVSEHNPAWSEEDENMLKIVIKSCEQCGNEYAYYWFKSLKGRVQLQSQWKPSDEQMEALNSLLLYGEFTYVGQAPCLLSLYIDLKAL